MTPSVEGVCVQAEAEGLLALPAGVPALLTDLDAPPRLSAHLHLVHDAACLLLDELRKSVRSFALDEDAVRFGAAIHDIGKALHPSELEGPGSRHELDGEARLVSMGVAPRRARFARTHGLDPAAESLDLEDLLVMAADKLWKGKRFETLEERIVEKIAERLRTDRWAIWEPVVSCFDAVTQDADRRLEWQARFPVR